jgi:IMP dehydrogenase
MSKLGGIGILHKFYEDTKVWEQDIISLRGINFGAAVGLNEDKKSQIAINSGAKILCIDVANGYLESVLNFTLRTADYIAKGNFGTFLMVGNVVTADGAQNLRMAGADMVRVGIGSGNLCTTRNVTGVGMPQLTALSLTSSINIRDHYYGEYDTIIVADGGIRNSGDAVKAFVFGADVGLSVSYYL